MSLELSSAGSRKSKRESEAWSPRALLDVDGKAGYGAGWGGVGRWWDMGVLSRDEEEKLPLGERLGFPVKNSGCRRSAMSQALLPLGMLSTCIISMVVVQKKRVYHD
jgi:hypothetical protein